MNRRSDADYDRPYGRYDQRRDDPAQYNDARYDQAPAAQGFETDYPSKRGQPAYNEQPRQDRPSRGYEDTAPSRPERAVRAYVPTSRRSRKHRSEPRRPADPGQQMWSPFDHREQVKTTSRR